MMNIFLFLEPSVLQPLYVCIKPVVVEYTWKKKKKVPIL